MSLEPIAAALGRYSKKANGGFMACCPVHEDHNPSLSLDEKDGNLLVKCFAGCSQKEVVQALKSRDLWPELTGFAQSIENKQITGETWIPLQPIPTDAPPPPQTHHWLGKPSIIWEYRDATGNLLQLSYRFDPPGQKKQVLPLTFCKSTDGHREWRWKALAAPRPLYGLDLIENQEQIVVVEGEKPADAGRRLLGPQRPVISWSGGCNAADKANWQPLAGKTITIWPDADLPGHKAALAVAEAALAAGAVSVKIVVPPEDVAMGWDLADAETEGWTRDQVQERLCAGLSLEDFRAQVLGSPDLEASVATEEQEVLPAKYALRPDGIYVEVEKRDGDTDFEWVCSPIEVRAMTRSAEGEDWGRLVAISDADGIEHLWPMPMGMMAGAGEEYRRELLSRGLRIAAGKGGQRLHNLLAMSKPSSRVRCVSRIGWHGRRFVLPDEVFGEAEEEPVLLQGGTGEHKFAIAGTLEDWQVRIGRLCVGNSRLIFSVCSALAAPLLNLASIESGGFHLIGGSSVGKTTALRVSGSVCGGGGLRGYIRQWRATDNGLEAVATAHCDTLLCLDEMSQVDGHTAGEVAYMLANGQGKARARRDGKSRAPQEWRTLFLSTGEVGLADKVAEDGRKKVTAGQAVRVVDIPADAGAGLGLFEDLHGAENGDKFARMLGEATEKTYGTPLRAFLQQLSLRLDDAIPLVAAFVKQFIEENCPGNADGQVRRVCARFGLVAAAGELGREFGVLPWPQGEANRAAVTCFKAWLVQRGGTGAAEVQAGIDQVVAFFEINGASRFESWGNLSDNKVINRAGFRRKNDMDEWEYYVFPLVFKNDICRGFDSRMLAAELIQREMLMPDKNGKASKAIAPPGTKRKRLYHFSSMVVSNGGDGD